jgi:hypothetical protein
MPHRILQQGIEAMQQGSAAEGARLIRIALKADDLPGDMKAVGYLWLAEAQTDAAGKREYYNAALAADPTNSEAKSRLARLLSTNLPSAVPIPQPDTSAYTLPVTQTGTMPAVAPRAINLADHMANIIGGVKGAGTAFFVTQDGILATTRAIVENREQVTAELHDGRQLVGRVIRAFPEYDLALIKVDAAPPQLLPIPPQSRVPDEATLYLYHYTGESIRAMQRPTKRVLAAHWLPTTFKEIYDAGGGPIFDERANLVGMITKSTGQTSDYLYALHIYAIRACVEQLRGEMQGGKRGYCPSCGGLCRAEGMGYFYCELCGATLPSALNLNRYLVPQAAALYETGTTRCLKCGSGAGIYQGRCLRCGQAQT